MISHNLPRVLALPLSHKPPCRAVVFGRVVEGMTTVKRMEVVGQRSGKPSRRVIIADSGQVGCESGVLQTHWHACAPCEARKL